MITGNDLMQAEQNIIDAYTRADAIADGEQVDVSHDAKEAGFRFPVYMTRAAFGATVEAGGRWQDNDDGDGQTLVLPHGQDVKGRLWDVLNVLLFAIRAENRQRNTIGFRVSVYGYDGTHRKKAVDLVSQCGPIDANDARPAITIMLPGED